MPRSLLYAWRLLLQLVGHNGIFFFPPSFVTPAVCGFSGIAQCALVVWDLHLFINLEQWCIWILMVFKCNLPVKTKCHEGGAVGHCNVVLPPPSLLNITMVCFIGSLKIFVVILLSFEDITPCHDTTLVSPLQYCVQFSPVVFKLTCLFMRICEKQLDWVAWPNRCLSATLSLALTVVFVLFSVHHLQIEACSSSCRVWLGKKMLTCFFFPNKSEKKQIYCV